MHDVTKYNRYGRNYTHLRKSTKLHAFKKIVYGALLVQNMPDVYERHAYLPDIPRCNRQGHNPFAPPSPRTRLLGRRSRGFHSFFRERLGHSLFCSGLRTEHCSDPSDSPLPNLGLGLASSSTCFPCGAFSNPCYHAAFVTSQARPRRRPCHHGGLSRWGMGSAWRWGRREGLDDLQRPNPPCSSESGEAVGCSLASSPWWCQNPPCPLPRGMVRSTVAAEAAKSPLW